MIDNRLRFTYRMNDDIDYEQEIFYDNGKAIGFVKVVDLLNALNRDNDKLRIDKLKFENKSLDLQKENEQLQKDRNNLAEECSELFKQNGRLKKENEKLREDLGFSEKYSQNPVDYKM